MSSASAWLSSDVETPLLRGVAKSRRDVAIKGCMLITLVISFLFGYIVAFAIHHKTTNAPCAPGLDGQQATWFSLSQVVMRQGALTYFSSPPGGWPWPAGSNTAYNPYPANAEGVILMPASFQNAIVTAMVNGSLVNGAGSPRQPDTKPRLHFTFHNGPNPNSTPQTAAALQAINLKGSFFVTGVNVDLYPNEITSLNNNGHHIGSRGYAHIDMTNASPATIQADLMKAETALNNLFPFSDTKPTLFNPPYGYLSPATLQVANQLQYTTVMWGLDSFDWANSDPNTVVDWIVAKVPAAGGLLLFHDSPLASQIVHPLVRRLSGTYDFVNSVLEV